MLQRNQAGLKMANILSDMVIVLASGLFAWKLRYDVLGGTRHLETNDATLVLLMILFSMVSTVILYLFNIYSPQRLKRGLCSLALMALLFIFKIIDMPRLTISISWFVSSLLISLKHIAFHGILHRMREKGYNLRHYVVAGSGKQAVQFERNIRENPFMGIVLEGYVSEEENPALGRRLGGYGQLDRVLDKGQYDGLVVALEPDEVGVLPKILHAADREGTQVELIPFYNDYYPSFPTFDTIGSSKLIDLRATPLNKPLNALLKRIADIAFSLLVLILLSPLLLAVASGVKISSPGPVLFRQERIGRDKKPFTIYKFRSMRVTGTENTGWSRNRDPRKTRFGSFIRKFSIDELPQFFNVLKGDMSVIGPRPEVPFHVSHFKEEIPRYLVRQQVRPGITGWAQVNGFRGDTSIEERVRYDIEYIENWTLGFDVRIAFRTVFGAMVNKEEII